MQLLHVPLTEAWDFFTSPGNLARITPPDMGFKVLTTFIEPAIYPGMEIDYIVKPLAGISLKWRTLITDVKPMKSFTDTQIKGPYSVWEHTHTFKEIQPGKIQMIDEVRYRLPLGVIGYAVHSLIVKNRIQEIFTFRRQALEKIFHDHVTLDH